MSDSGDYHQMRQEFEHELSQIHPQNSLVGEALYHVMTEAASAQFEQDVAKAREMLNVLKAVGPMSLETTVTTAAAALTRLEEAHKALIAEIMSPHVEDKPTDSSGYVIKQIMTAVTSPPPKIPKIVGIHSRGGGEYRTTLVAQLAKHLTSDKQLKVMMMDGTSNCNLTLKFAGSEIFELCQLEEHANSTYKTVLTKGEVTEDLRWQGEQPGLSLLPGTLDCQLVNLDSQEYRRRLQNYGSRYNVDLILIDLASGFDSTTEQLVFTCDLIYTVLNPNAHSFTILHWLHHLNFIRSRHPPSTEFQGPIWAGWLPIIRFRSFALRIIEYRELLLSQWSQLGEDYKSWFKPEILDGVCLANGHGLEQEPLETFADRLLADMGHKA